MATTFFMALVLQYLENDEEVIIRTGTSDYISTGVLSCYENKGMLNAVAYVLKKHTLTYCNYDLYY